MSSKDLPPGAMNYTVLGGGSNPDVGLKNDLL